MLIRSVHRPERNKKSLKEGHLVAKARCLAKAILVRGTSDLERTRGEGR